MNNRPAEDIDYTKYGWVPPKQQLPSANPSASADDIDYTKYGWVPPESEESKAKSIAMAVPRVAKDLGVSLFDALKSIPGYYESSKSEIPGLVDVVTQHPGHAAKQLGAGLSEAIFNTANIPHKLAKYGEERLHIAPHFLQSITPEWKDSENQQAISQLFGDPQYAGDALIRGVGRNAPALGLSGKILSALNPAKLTKGAIIKDVLGTEAKNKATATAGYNSIWNDAKNVGVSDMSHTMPNIDMQTISKYSPKKSIQGLNDFSQDHSIQNAHAAKSDLLRIQRSLDQKTTLNTAERKHKKAVDDAIGSIEDNMFKDSNGVVNKDLKDRYRQQQSQYREDVIPYSTNKAIGQYKRNELSKSELISRISKGKFAAQKGAEHPNIARRKVAANLLKGAGIAGTAAGTYGIGNALYHYLTGVPHE